MSELINNSEKRKELLKHMILQLHEGEAPDEVRGRLVNLMSKIPYNEVVEVEQELISEGVLEESEVLKFCDIHTEALQGAIDQSGAIEAPLGHPVDTFIRENKELIKVIAEVKVLFADAEKLESGEQIADYFIELRGKFNLLMDVDKHYQRKENLLFPYLEKYGITGPPKVMWGKHDETREFLKAAIEALQIKNDISIEEVESLIEMILSPAVEAIADMTLKEEEILFPMSMDKLSDTEWYEINKQTHEIGYCLFDPSIEWKPEGLEELEEKTSDDGLIHLNSGSFTKDELNAILNTLPIDMTFVDRNDKVKYFSQGRERIFQRNRAILNRDVLLCHPPSSAGIVEKILDDFNNNVEDRAPFWIQMGDKFIHIEYFALKDEKGNFLGTLEVSQDLTEKRKLEGEQRILSYGNNK
ncbi:MAG: DUF438 domain-containing protein [Bacteroidales bacterium]|nr:DUF438 domain-containing protein [Bacteroidales bacterium]